MRISYIKFDVLFFVIGWYLKVKIFCCDLLCTWLFPYVLRYFSRISMQYFGFSISSSCLGHFRAQQYWSHLRKNSYIELKLNPGPQNFPIPLDRPKHYCWAITSPASVCSINFLLLLIASPINFYKFIMDEVSNVPTQTFVHLAKTIFS